MRKRTLLIVALVALVALACNLPSFSRPGSDPTPTPAVYVTIIVATPTPVEGGDEGAESDPTLTPTATATLTTTQTPTATATLTATATPSGPTATPTLAPPGPPLSFADPAWEIKEWHPIEGTDDWEGTLKIHVVGGTPPYRSQLDVGPVVAGTEVYARWRQCKVMPATIRVWSADGQEVSTGIWVWELGCDP